MGEQADLIIEQILDDACFNFGERNRHVPSISRDELEKMTTAHLENLLYADITRASRRRAQDIIYERRARYVRGLVKLQEMRNNAVR